MDQWCSSNDKLEAGNFPAYKAEETFKTFFRNLLLGKSTDNAARVMANNGKCYSVVIDL
jgi:hypothetical protein